MSPRDGRRKSNEDADEDITAGASVVVEVKHAESISTLAWACVQSHMTIAVTVVLRLVGQTAPLGVGGLLGSLYSPPR